jgi:iron complex outermembrane receptor protein
MAVARGFFGGGETDYVLLLVDGRPINDVRTGLAEWTQIPLATIDRIEVLRGGGSVAYGDAALGAVVNVVTRAAQQSQHASGSLQLGSWDDRAVASSIDRTLGSDRVTGGVTAARVEGFRSHAKAENLALSGGYTWRERGPVSAYARLGVQRLRNQEPGPLPPEEIAINPRQYNPLFASDERRRDVVELSTGVTGALGGGRLGGDVRVRVADDEQTRTIPLSVGVGDTQFQDARSWDFLSRVLYSRRSRRSTIVAGVEFERGTYDISYSDPVDRTALQSQGNGMRDKIGQYAELQQQISRQLRLVGGIRFDLITLDGGAAELGRPRFSQWSPRVGLNFNYSASASHVGNAYITWSRSFKAPTAAQLYDVRLIRTGEPGVAINLSNPALRPQHSSGIEVGVSHSLALWRSGAFADLTLSAYRLDVTDEIDFDLRTFKYGNILGSRHDGLEGSLLAHLSSWLTTRHALTLTHITVRRGDYAGNVLKNIPQTVATSALQFSLGKGVEATATHRFSGSLFLDDSNSERLPGTHHFDATLSWAVGALRLDVTAMNLGNSHASTGGFLLYDPDRGANVRWLYPGSGRYLRAGVAVDR